MPTDVGPSTSDPITMLLPHVGDLYPNRTWVSLSLCIRLLRLKRSAGPEEVIRRQAGSLQFRLQTWRWTSMQSGMRISGTMMPNKTTSRYALSNQVGSHLICLWCIFCKKPLFFFRSFMIFDACNFLWAVSMLCYLGVNVTCFGMYRITTVKAPAKVPVWAS